MNKLDFPNKKELTQSNNISFKIIIPLTRNKTISISKSALQKRVKVVSDFIVKKFKGATIEYGQGYYAMKNKIVKERVVIVSVFTNNNTYNYYDKELEHFLREKKHSWGQDSIGFEYQGKMIFV